MNFVTKKTKYDSDSIQRESALTELCPGQLPAWLSTVPDSSQLDSALSRSRWNANFFANSTKFAKSVIIWKRGQLGLNSEFEYLVLLYCDFIFYMGCLLMELLLKLILIIEPWLRPGSQCNSVKSQKEKNTQLFGQIFSAINIWLCPSLSACSPSTRTMTWRCWFCPPPLSSVLTWGPSACHPSRHHRQGHR